jgi:DNA/RNA-binding protein KIN17
LVASSALKSDYKRGDSSSAGNNEVSKKYGRGKGENRVSALDEIIKDEENKKQHLNRKDFLLVIGIIVKVTPESLGDKYHRKKGVVIGLPDKYVASVHVR